MTIFASPSAETLRIKNFVWHHRNKTDMNSSRPLISTRAEDRTNTLERNASARTEAIPSQSSQIPEGYWAVPTYGVDTSRARKVFRMDGTGDVDPFIPDSVTLYLRNSILVSLRRLYSHTAFHKSSGASSGFLR
nr:uncharacterized protein I203_07737 [Kwoniella mangroviensis CBS 8507]OCF63312.1 hypothetical protein I203_07737 [Kwoniella mangroviensis CBS 8507]